MDKRTKHSYKLEGKVSKTIEPGNYILGLVIIDTTKNNTPGISIAMEDPEKIKGWRSLTSLSITK